MLVNVATLFVLTMVTVLLVSGVGVSIQTTVDLALQSSLLNLPGNQLFGTDVEPVRSMPVSFVASHALGSVPNLASHALGSTRTIVTALYQNKGCMLCC